MGSSRHGRYVFKIQLSKVRFWNLNMADSDIGAAIRVMTSLGKPITSTAASASTSIANSNDLPLTENTWLFGLLVGAPFLLGAPLGLLITDRLTEIWRFGRRGAICVAGLFSFISVV